MIAVKPTIAAKQRINTAALMPKTAFQILRARRFIRSDVSFLVAMI